MAVKPRIIKSWNTILFVQLKQSPCKIEIDGLIDMTTVALQQFRRVVHDFLDHGKWGLLRGRKSYE